MLDPDIRPEASLVPIGPDPGHALLTGATGLLGTFLLHDLLRQTASTVHCLVRAPDAATGMERLRQSLDAYALWDNDFGRRIVPVLGDLAQPLLGLNRRQFDELASRLDVIYHNGAFVNFIHPYKTLEAANVLGTQEVLRLASCGRIKTVHYVSTISVFDGAGRDGQRIIGEDECLDHGGQLHGDAGQSDHGFDDCTRVRTLT